MFETMDGKRSWYQNINWTQVAGYALDVVLVAFDVATFPSGEAAALIAGRRALWHSMGAANGKTTVIGRVKDLKHLKQGEKSLLDRLPNLDNPKANWKQNSGVLRQEMGKGRPIRDASPDDNLGQFLNAERNLLKDRGWKFDRQTGYWSPP